MAKRTEVRELRCNEAIHQKIQPDFGLKSQSETRKRETPRTWVRKSLFDAV